MGNGNKTRKKKLFVVVGKTSTGKDTVCNYMNQRYGIKPVVSYSTREMRSYEKNGVQHFFISDQEMIFSHGQNFLKPASGTVQPYPVLGMRKQQPIF